MNLVVDPDAVSSTGAGLRSLARSVPDLHEGLHGTTGSAAVDAALDPFFASARTGLADAAEAVGRLGDAAVDAADAFAETDRRLARP